MAPLDRFFQPFVRLDLMVNRCPPKGWPLLTFGLTWQYCQQINLSKNVYDSSRVNLKGGFWPIFGVLKGLGRQCLIFLLLRARRNHERDKQLVTFKSSGKGPQYPDRGIEMIGERRHTAIASCTNGIRLPKGVGWRRQAIVLISKLVVQKYPKATFLNGTKQLLPGGA
jgi:hypothetical protein